MWRFSRRGAALRLSLPLPLVLVLLLVLVMVLVASLNCQLSHLICSSPFVRDQIINFLSRHTRRATSAPTQPPTSRLASQRADFPHPVLFFVPRPAPQPLLPPPSTSSDLPHVHTHAATAQLLAPACAE